MDSDVLHICNLAQYIMLGYRPHQFQIAVADCSRRIGSGDELPSYLGGGMATARGKVGWGR
jgi:hypothetical protein